MVELSIVIITKNQDWNVKRLLNSVLENTKHIHSLEIVLVDSASTDKTTDFAFLFPIKIFRLNPENLLTAAAGRYIGYKNTKGRFILFLDGDMELVKGWIEIGISKIKKEPGIGVISGKIIDIPITSSTSKEIIKFSIDSVVRCSEVKMVGGAALYRRSVLDKVKSFNPFVYSDEEPELCLRIRKAGFRVLYTNFPIAYHYTKIYHKISSLISRRNKRLYFGYGQNIRYTRGTGILISYLLERGHAFYPMLIIIFGLFCLVLSIILKKFFWVVLWIILVLLIFLALSCKKKSMYKAASSFIEKLFIIEGTFRGYFLKPLKLSEHPLKYENLNKRKLNRSK